MKTCPDCAEEVKEAARVCRFCGYRFDEPMGAPTPPDAPSEGMGLMRKTCADCGASVEAAARVCEFCGYRFDMPRGGRTPPSDPSQVEPTGTPPPEAASDSQEEGSSEDDTRVGSVDRRLSIARRSAWNALVVAIVGAIFGYASAYDPGAEAVGKTNPALTDFLPAAIMLWCIAFVLIAGVRWLAQAGQETKPLASTRMGSPPPLEDASRDSCSWCGEMLSFSGRCLSCGRREFDLAPAQALALREHIPQQVRDQVWRRDQNRCVQCGSNYRLELDHIQPVSAGGRSTYRNLQLLCERCNREKGATW